MQTCCTSCSLCVTHVCPRASNAALIGGNAAIVPIMIYDATLSQIMANKLLEKGIYVVGFFFPVVPKEKARIRVQLSASHNKEQLDKVITSFIEVGQELKIIMDS